MESRRYIVNGVEYESLEDVPAAFRAWFADTDGDGVPDKVEATADGGTTVTRRVWRGKVEDAPPELRQMIEESGSEGGAERWTAGTSRVVSRRRRPARPSDSGGARLTASLELRGWESFPGETDALELRPGSAAISRWWGTAAAAVILSILILIGDGWPGDAWRIGLHGGLWLLALLWFASPFWMRLRLIRDDVHDKVWIRGRRMLFLIRQEFPLGAASLSVRASFRRRRPRSTESDGWRWTMMILGEHCRPLVADIGFTLGREEPASIPGDVKALCRQLADTFNSPVDIQVPGRGRQHILPDASA